MLIHKGTVTLTTPRLTLRRLTIQDAQAMYDNWASDEAVPRFMSWDTHKSIEETTDILTKWVSEYDKPDYYHWAIIYDDIIIGTIGLETVSSDHEYCYMGYCIGSKWWNKGIMTEAVGAVICFVFAELNANKICALHDTANIGSGKVMINNGMKQEGLLREHKVRKDGTRGDMACYAILKSEWEAI